MPIHETISALEDIKQQDLNQTVGIARNGLVHSGELRGWLNTFDKHLNELPFSQIEGKLQDVGETAKTGEAQCHEVGDKLLRAVGDTDNEHAKSAVQATYNIGDLMGVSYWEDGGTTGVQLLIEQIQEELTALQGMASAMREKLGSVKELAEGIGEDFLLICGSTGSERMFKRLIGMAVLGKNEALVATVKEEITAYQQHLNR